MFRNSKRIVQSAPIRLNTVHQCHLVNARFLLKDDLCVACNACTEGSGETKRLVKGVGVQGLRASKHGRHRLHSCTHDVVVRVLQLQLFNYRALEPWRGCNVCECYEGASGLE